MNARLIGKEKTSVFVYFVLEIVKSNDVLSGYETQKFFSTLTPTFSRYNNHHELLLIRLYLI